MSRRGERINDLKVNVLKINVKARLDRALSTLLWWKVSLPMVGGWNWVIYKVPSNPNRFMIMIL